jgi:hypothetical protein
MTWTPKSGSTTLDTVSSEAWPAFQWKLLRNGHVVALFVTEAACYAKLQERRIALPLDYWEMVAR